MNYVYPKLSEHDLGIVRLGGAGLGNILFTYARAAVYARNHNCRLIWPTWPSIKLGTYLRRERDKRFYGDLFVNRTGCIAGIKKLWLLARCPRIPEREKESLSLQEETILQFEGFENCFEEILYDYQWVYENLKKNLASKYRAVLDYDFSDSIGVHIRLGDFARVSAEEVRAGRHDSSLPMEWYVSVICQIREYARRDIRVLVFSDGTDEELAPVLELPNTRRLTFGSSIADMIGLAGPPLLVASGSSFSMWGRYLGRHSCICYTNQIKQKILTPEETAFEYETEGIIEEAIGEKIRRIYTGK